MRVGTEHDHALNKPQERRLRRSITGLARVEAILGPPLSGPGMTSSSSIPPRDHAVQDGAGEASPPDPTLQEYVGGLPKLPCDHADMAGDTAGTPDPLDTRTILVPTLTSTTDSTVDSRKET